MKWHKVADREPPRDGRCIVGVYEDGSGVGMFHFVGNGWRIWGDKRLYSDGVKADWLQAWATMPDWFVPDWSEIL